MSRRPAIDADPARYAYSRSPMEQIVLLAFNNTVGAVKGVYAGGVAWTESDF